MSKIKRMFQIRTALALATWAAYAVAFIPLYHLLGPIASAFAMLPVGVTGWLFGMWPGLLAGGVGVLLDVLLVSLVGGAGWVVMFQTGLPGTVLLVGSGIAIGRLRDSAERVKRELAQRKRAEEEVRRDRDFAEKLTHSNAFITALSRVAARIAITHDLDQVMRAVGTELKALGITCWVTRVEPDRQAMILEYTSIDSAALKLAEKVTGIKLLGRRMPRELWRGDVTIDGGRPRIEKDLVALGAKYFPRLPRTLIERLVRLLGMGPDIRLAWLPLLIEHRVVGVLGIWGPELREEHLPLLMVFAGQVASAIENARLYEALRKSQERYRTISELASDWTYSFRVHPDGSLFLEWMTEAGSRIMGLTTDQVRPRGWRAHTHPDDLPIAERKAQALLSGQPAAEEYRIVTASGEVRWIRDYGKPVWDDTQGRVVRIYGATQDITERKRAEEALAEERNMLRTLIDSLADCIYVKDAQSRFVLGNHAVAGLMGAAAPHELVGKTDFDFYPRDLAARYYADEQEIIRSGQPLVEREEPLMDQTTGKRGWLLTTKVPLGDTEGQIVGLVGIGRDITQRKLAEQQLQRYADELEQRNREIRDFTYIVSHDFRAPLVNLKGFSAELRSAAQVIEAAMPGAEPHLDETQRQAVAMALQEDVPEALDFIESSVSQMDKYISAMLKLSRLGRREIKPEPVDMETLVRDILETLAHQIAERQAKVTVGPLPQMVADRTSMEQIIGNLLSNALKFLDPEGPGEIEISGERRDGETTFQVRDNGRGISPEDLDKVFMPFRRVGRQDTPGEGMGLPYVQALVRRHGGQIRCESELGMGTTFTFSISDHLADADDHSL